MSSWSRGDPEVGPRHYQILDVGLCLESSQESFLENFHQDYLRFSVPVLAEGRHLHIHFEGRREAAEAFLEVDGARESLEGHPRPDLHAAQIIAQILMDRVEAFTILHGAVLGRENRALAISGASGAGKTTLTLALLESGWSYLSDDFCPIHRKTGLTHPFPRSLWVRPSPGEESRNRRRGKLLYPLDGHGFRIETHPCPLKWLICLENGASENERPTERFRIAFHKGKELPILTEFQTIEGLTLQKTGGAESLGWLVTYSRNPRSTERIKQLLAHHQKAIWNVYTLPGCNPDFTKAPRLESISPHEAAFLLLRELKHSLTGGLRPGALLAHLGGLLAEVSCYRLSPGPLNQRLDLIQTIVRGT
jgi:hypothetical protein